MDKPEIDFVDPTPPSDLVVKDLTVGDGDEAVSGTTVAVHYVGVAHSTGEEFDASYNRGDALRFTLGAGQVISGWDRGITGMKVGGRRQLVIPPHLAYGDRGAGSVIKPGETLVFVCDLVGVSERRPDHERAAQAEDGVSTARRALFVGGSGTISSAVTALAVEEGVELTLLTRGSSARAVPDGVEQLVADVRDPASVRRVLGDREFDAVVDWVAFTPDHVRTDLELFEGRTGQYVFISSASAYQTPPSRLPIRESTPLRNPFWQYSRDKIACEDLLTAAYRERGVPVTVVRPSHTYDRTLVPFDAGWTFVERMRQGKEVVVHGDGTSLWTLTHHTDFARGFLPLLGNPRALGEAFHITSDDVLTWDQVAHALAAAAGTEARIVHVPSDAVAAVDEGWGAGLLGDKANSSVFDNTKVKELAPDFVCRVPFEQGAREIVAWHDEDPARRVVDPHHDRLQDELVERFRVAAR